MKKFFLLALGIGLLHISASAQSATEAIGKAVNQLKQAMLDADSAALVRLAHDKLSYGHSNGRIEDRAAFISALTSGRSDFRTINLSEQTVTIAGNTALVRHKLNAQTLDAGKEGEVNLLVLLVWTKEKGRWQLLARQAVRQPQ